MSTIPIGSTDKARTAQAVIIVNRATGDLAEAGVGAGTSNTTEATQLLVKAAVEAIQAAVETPADKLPPQPLLDASDLTRAFSSSSASGEVSLVAAVSGQTTRAHRIICSAAGATTVELRDGASGAALRVLEFPAAGAYVLDFSERPYAKTTANTALIRYSSAAVKVTIGVDHVTAA